MVKDKKERSHRTAREMSGKVGGTKAFAHEQPKGYSTNVRPRKETQFGTMISSTKQTAPAAGMGSSKRHNRDKVHISETHALNSMRGMESPGPIYKPRTRTDEILVRGEGGWGAYRSRVTGKGLGRELASRIPIPHPFSTGVVKFFFFFFPHSLPRRVKLNSNDDRRRRRGRQLTTTTRKHSAIRS